MSNEKNIVQIVDFAPQYREAFKALNQAWIEQYFKMEAADFKALDEPEKNIIEKDGFILVALVDETVAGVCALVKLEHMPFDYELAKMAVDPAFQGQGIGYLLGEAIVNKAKSLEAQTLFLESNTILKPAINLYQKLGFVEIPKTQNSPYERSNIWMVLEFNSR